LIMEKKLKSAIYPGTFDPITLGHLDVISRALTLFDKLIVAVAPSPSKRPFFPFEERVEMVKEAVKANIDSDSVIVTGFEGLTVEFARKMNATAMIRGLRAVTDFEYELQIALTNRKIAQDIESVFLMPSVEYIYLNSTMVREVAKHGGDVTNFVPENVYKKLIEKFGTKND